MINSLADLVEVGSRVTFCYEDGRVFDGDVTAETQYGFDIDVNGKDYVALCSEIIAIHAPDGRYDSRPDTIAHIRLVQGGMDRVIADLQRRSEFHDQSKMVAPEVEVFDEFTPKLRGLTYGSPEYKESLDGMKVGLDHHYAANDHHPEHHPTPETTLQYFDIRRIKDFIQKDFTDETTASCAYLILDEKLASMVSRIRSMNLVQIMEMLCDWVAATKRHADGDILKSIDINQKRFGYSDEMKAILINTLPLIMEPRRQGPENPNPSEST